MQSKSYSKGSSEAGRLKRLTALHHQHLFRLMIYTRHYGHVSEPSYAAEDIAALEVHLKKVGAVETAHSPAPSVSSDHSPSDGERVDFLVKLMIHVRLHFLYLAEKLQEQLMLPQDDVATASASSGQVTAVQIACSSMCTVC